MNWRDLNKPFFGKADKLDRWRWKTDGGYIIDRRWFLAAFALILSLGAIAVYQAYIIGPEPPYPSAFCPDTNHQPDCINNFYEGCRDVMNPFHEVGVMACGTRCDRPEKICQRRFLTKGETLEITPPGIVGDVNLYIILSILASILCNHYISNRRRR